MNNEILFEVYKQYIINTAIKESRPFRMPTSLSTLEKRTDKTFFYVLSKKLFNHNIKKRQQIKLFFETARLNLIDFHISNIVDDYEDIISIFKTIKTETPEDKKKKIKIAFEYLFEYCIINNINKFNDLLKGNPPIILKLWKKGEVDERILIHILDLKKIKKKTWSRIYCNNLILNITKIQKDLNNDNLVSFIESELLKIKNNLRSN